MPLSRQCDNGVGEATRSAWRFLRSSTLLTWSIAPSNRAVPRVRVWLLARRGGREGGPVIGFLLRDFRVRLLTEAACVAMFERTSALDQAAKRRNRAPPPRIFNGVA